MRLHDFANLYRAKAEEARKMAQGMSRSSARNTVLDVAKTWEWLADQEEQKLPKTNSSGWSDTTSR